MASETPAERWRLVRAADIQPSLRLTLYALNCFQGSNSTAYCKRETLAEEVGVHVDQLSRKLQALEKLGVIKSSWTKRNDRPCREHSIDFDQLRKMQRSTLTISSECEGGTLTDSSESTLTFSTEHSDVAHSSTLMKSSDMNIHRTSKNIQSGASLPKVPSVRKSKQAADGRLTAFCLEWNNWHSAGIVGSKIRDTDSPGKTIADAWSRSQRDLEQCERLANLTGIRTAIECGQSLLKSAAWFDAAGLIGGKNKNHRWYAEQLMAGTYRDKSATGSTLSSEAEQAWQIVLDSIRRHSRFKSELIMGEVGERAWQALRPIGVKNIDEATDYKKQEFKTQFIKAFNEQVRA